MSSEWRTGKLGDFIELKRGYDLPQAKRSMGTVPLVSSSGVTDRHSVAMVKGPGVVTGRYGTIGQVFYVEDDFWPLNTTLYVRDFKGNSPQFIHYFLKTVDFFAYSDKAAVPGVNRNHLHEAQATIPPPSVQNNIACFLGAIDDRITLLRETNATLGTIAQALFKSWFVDFDPVRDKSAGRVPQGIDESTAALFPKTFEDSELGLLPKGWRVEPLTAVFDFKEGPGIRNWQYTNSDEGTKFINIRCIQDGDLSLATASRITDEEANGKYAHFHLQEWDVVVSTSGTLGRSAIVRKEHLPLMLNTSVIRFRPIRPIMDFGYCYQYLNSSEFLYKLESMASGSVQKNFGPMHIKQIKFVCPPPELISRYESLSQPIIEKVIANRAQIASLADLRDTLRPRLISGKLRINENSD